MQEKDWRKESSNSHVAYKNIIYQTILLWKNKNSGYLPGKIYTDFPRSTSKTEEGPIHLKRIRIHLKFWCGNFLT